LLLVAVIAIAVFFFYRTVLFQRVHAAFRTALKPARQELGPLHTYFVNAVTVYVWLGDPGAKLAALAAAHTTSASRRASMRLYLGEMASALGQQMSVSEHHLQYSARFREMEEELEDHTWTAEDIREATQQLLDRNPEYLQALRQNDFTVFPRTYPDLFRALGLSV
jgi:phosphoenolpyruvate carboxylase